MQEHEHEVGAKDFSPLLLGPPEPLTILGWLWRGRAGYRPEHANIWASMIDRNLSLPHRFVLMTDLPEDRWSELDPRIEPIPLWQDWHDLRNSGWDGPHRPSCYVRLQAFSRHAEDIFGRRFVSIDLDCIVIDDLTPLFDRDEDFLIMRRTPVHVEEEASTYQGGMWMLRAGARARVWEDFEGQLSITAAAQYMGTDQAWIRYCLGPDEAGWTQDDGVYCWRNIYADPRYFDQPPANARIIFSNTSSKPWDLANAIRLFSRCQDCKRELAKGQRVRCPYCKTVNVRPVRHDWIAEYYQ